MFAAQSVEIHMAVVETRDHGETGEPAFGRFGLSNVGQAPARSDQRAQETHHGLQAEKSRLKIQITMLRRSNKMSALTCMSACNGMSLP